MIRMILTFSLLLATTCMTAQISEENIRNYIVGTAKGSKDSCHRERILELYKQFKVAYEKKDTAALWRLCDRQILKDSNDSTDYRKMLKKLVRCKRVTIDKVKVGRSFVEEGIYGLTLHQRCDKEEVNGFLLLALYFNKNDKKAQPEVMAGLWRYGDDVREALGLYDLSL
ncbi:hypothetical protein [Segatella hominis]|uniref:hypothetical protein n=1 Tax=Segatella hominis TaxID=2518605 RepID=UPI003AB96FA2